MKPEHVVAIALRLFAIALLLYTLSSFIGSAWVFFASGSNDGATVLMIIVTVLMLAGALFLWRFSLWIASKLVRFDKSIDKISTPISLDELQTMAFTVLGIYLLLKGSQPEFIGVSYLMRYEGTISMPDNGRQC